MQKYARKMAMIFFIFINIASANDHIKIPDPIRGNNPNLAPSLLATDVLARVILIRDEIELIRLYMGREKAIPKRVPVKNAAPREVYFQAMTLLQKVEKLAYEVTRTQKDSPPLPKEISLLDVWKLVNKSLGRVLLIKKTLGITTKIKEKLQPKKTTSNDVYKHIVQVNKQVNLILTKKIQPSDVFQKVTLAINYTERLLEFFPRARRIPKTPIFIHKKTPTDVYRKLVKCFHLVTQIAKVSKVKILTLELKASEVKNIIPGDVFDLASLIVSEVANFHSLLPNLRQPANTYYSGIKYPSHVFQRASLLKIQLDNLIKQTEKKPKWLIKMNKQE